MLGGFLILCLTHPWVKVADVFLSQTLLPETSHHLAIQIYSAMVGHGRPEDELM